ncbi:MAG: hypothetical protein M3Q74_12070 [Pseudomonadota bacterium]|nr:hypothetical protein [Pseudomonadota bacterium]
MKVSKPELSFQDRVAGIWGGLEEIVRTADDPDLAMADFFQVTLQQLVAWRAAEGRQRCPGVTTRGHGCRNYASAVVDYDPRVWVARDPGFCPNHMKSQHDMAAARKIAGRNVSAEDDAGLTAR